MDERGGLVLVIDDDLSIREGLGSLLRAAGLDVETFGSAAEFLARPPVDAPSCLVLDVQLPDLSGLGLQARLAQGARTTPIVFITGHGDVPTTVRAMKAGAVDFLTKPFDGEALLAAVRLGLSRDREARQRGATVRALVTRHASLTERQQQVMALVVQGLLNKQIAAELGITEVTVKIHRGRVMKGMGAGSLAELVRMADRLRAETH